MANTWGIKIELRDDDVWRLVFAFYTFTYGIFEWTELFCWKMFNIDFIVFYYFDTYACVHVIFFFLVVGPFINE